MKKLETIISKSKNSGGVYVDFPTTRKELRRRLSNIGISKDKWIVRGVKTGSNHFGNIVANSKNLDELNYLGYWMSQFDDDQYHLFFHLCDVFKNDTNSVADCINIAANIKCYCMLRRIANAEKLGRWRVSEYLKNNDADSLAVWESIDREYAELGYQYAAEKHGRFFNGNFYARTDDWSLAYLGEIDDIPEHLLVDEIRI